MYVCRCLSVAAYSYDLYTTNYSKYKRTIQLFLTRSGTFLCRNLAETMNTLLDSALSVAALTDYIQLLLEDDDHLRQVWVVGEVTSVSPHRSGTFFALQDPISKALINCVVWQSQQARLTTPPQPGEQVLVLGTIKLYPGQGRYQFTVSQCLPVGEGLRSVQARKLKQRLESEGMFDVAAKQAIPVHPRVIAIVTSPTAAAWGDIQKTLSTRYPGMNLLFSGAIVQGEHAPKSIVKAIERVVQDGRAEVLILARGGGATEDLACFNEEIVVRAIATCPIPVITGIGHERDESLADLVADVCAHTPTAAAARSVPALSDLIDLHADRVHWLQSAVRKRLDQEVERTAQLHDRLLRVRPDRLLAQEKQKLDWLKQRLVQAIRSELTAAQNHQTLLQEKALSLDPNAVLKRGYALVRSGDTIVRDRKNVNVGQTIEVQLGEGKIQAVVQELL
jgi:exodeoxyribonuclease VII large subunit